MQDINEVEWSLSQIQRNDQSHLIFSESFEEEKSFYKNDNQENEILEQKISILEWIVETQQDYSQRVNLLERLLQNEVDKNQQAYKTINELKQIIQKQNYRSVQDLTQIQTEFINIKQQYFDFQNLFLTINKLKQVKQLRMFQYTSINRIQQIIKKKTFELKHNRVINILKQFQLRELKITYQQPFKYQKKQVTQFSLTSQSILQNKSYDNHLKDIFLTSQYQSKLFEQKCQLEKKYKERIKSLQQNLEERNIYISKIKNTHQNTIFTAQYMINKYVSNKINNLSNFLDPLSEQLLHLQQQINKLSFLSNINKVNYNKQQQSFFVYKQQQANQLSNSTQFNQQQTYSLIATFVQNKIEQTLSYLQSDLNLNIIQQTQLIYNNQLEIKDKISQFQIQQTQKLLNSEHMVIQFIQDQLQISLEKHTNQTNWLLNHLENKQKTFLNKIHKLIFFISRFQHKHHQRIISINGKIKQIKTQLKIIKNKKTETKNIQLNEIRKIIYQLFKDFNQRTIQQQEQNVISNKEKINKERAKVSIFYENKLQSLYESIKKQDQLLQDFQSKLQISQKLIDDQQQIIQNKNQQIEDLKNSHQLQNINQQNQQQENKQLELQLANKEQKIQQQQAQIQLLQEQQQQCENQFLEIQDQFQIIKEMYKQKLAKLKAKIKNTEKDNSNPSKIAINKIQQSRQNTMVNNNKDIKEKKAKSVRKLNSKVIYN